MPFALIVIGIVILVTAINNTWRQLGSQVYKDLFSNDGGFVYWVAGIVIVGLIGYVPALKKPSDTFMVLIILAMLLQNKGFFTQLQQGLQAGPGAGGSTTATAGSAANPAQGALSAATGGVNLFSGAFGGMVINGLAMEGNEPLTTPAPGNNPSGGIGAA